MKCICTRVAKWRRHARRREHRRYILRLRDLLLENREAFQNRLVVDGCISSAFGGKMPPWAADFRRKTGARWFDQTFTQPEYEETA